MPATHRVWQLFSALRPSLKAEERHSVERYLSPAQFALFCRMPERDQSHAVRVLRHLLSRGHDNPSLLQAALLHDAGKSVAAVGLVTRVAAVLLRLLGQHAIHKLGNEDGARWRRALFVHAHHASIGAKLATEAGSAPEVVRLIEGHSGPPQGESARALYEADEAS